MKRSLFPSLSPESTPAPSSLSIISPWSFAHATLSSLRAVLSPNSNTVPSTPTLCGEIDGNLEETVGGRFRGKDHKRRRVDLGRPYLGQATAPASIQTVPSEVLALVLQYISVPSSWSACTKVCRQWRQVALSSPVAGKLRLWDDATSVGALQLETEATNINRLEFFASKKNPHAPYLLGVMLCYTGSLNRGVKWFDEGAKLGDVRCLYGKGVVVRDGDKVEGDRCLALAASMGYYPAQLEMPPPIEGEEKIINPPVEELKDHMLPKCLLRYLRRWFVEDSMARGKRTSHCWNTECGKWAEKSTSTNSADPNFAPLTTPAAAPTSPDKAYGPDFKLSRMKMCSSCRRAKYCSKICQVYDWRKGRHKSECAFLS